jgi:succinate dehydrogenase / fumarate reductase cytochrome b subunit
MNILVRAYSSSLGKKYVMAITGLALFVFVIVHMAGNLQIYAGREAINNYAAFLQSKPGLLWTARISLLAILIMHIWAALQLVSANSDARPTKYGAGKKPVAASYASRTIFISGLVIFAFIIYHLMHFTLGVTNPEFVNLKDPVDPLHHDVYAMMVRGFSNWAVSGFYILAMALLCLHLSHGVSSSLQSLGLRNRSNVAAIHLTARLAALIIFLGNISIPISILAGWVK